MGGKESFDIELSTWMFVAKAFGVDAACHCGVLVHFLDFAGGLILEVGQGDFTFDAGVVFNDIKDCAFFQSGEDGREGLEAAHAFEGVNDTDGNGEIFVPFGFLEEISVHGEIGVGEVEFDLRLFVSNGKGGGIENKIPYLLADLDWVTALLLCSEIRLDIVAVIGFMSLRTVFAFSIPVVRIVAIATAPIRRLAVGQMVYRRL